MKYIIETLSQLVFHRHLSLPQHRGSLPTHDSLILLRTNFHCENCQFALTAFMLARYRRVQECLHAADAKSALRAIRQVNLMKNFHWAYNMHLVHLKESEACDLEVTQFKVIASSTFCSYLLNLWRNIFRVQNSCSHLVSAQSLRWLWNTVSATTYIPLRIYSSHTEWRFWEKALRSVPRWKDFSSPSPGTQQGRFIGFC